VAWRDAQKADRSETPPEDSGAEPHHEELAPAAPTVRLGPDEHRVVDQVGAALVADVDIFQRAGSLCQVMRQQGPDDGIRRDTGSPVIVAIGTPTLREKITRFCRIEKYGARDKKWDRAHPPPWLVSALHARGAWPGIRNLIAISDVPILRPDGSILQVPGFDPSTGVLFEPNAEFPHIDDNVSIDDAAGAAERLLDIVVDFPFEAPAHRSAWLAAAISRPARHAYSGPTPLFLADANVPGAGKTLLQQLIGQINLGREMPVSSYAHDSAEMAKKITASAIAGDTMLLLDNLVGPFGNDVLDRALTTTRWKDRILGVSENADLPLTIVWFATGNNVILAGDIIRRIIHIRLDALTERPEERQGFKYPDISLYVRQHRPQLLVDALTIPAAYIRAGRPRQSLQPMGSFEGWSALVREAVVWLGYPDPCLTRLSLAASADGEGDALTDLMAAWSAYDSAQNGLQIPELMRELYAAPAPGDPASVALRAAVETITGCPPGRTPAVRQLSNRLRTSRRRVSGGRYFDHNPNELRRGGVVWRLLTVTSQQEDKNVI
jgi:hypothetical protein